MMGVEWIERYKGFCMLCLELYIITDFYTRYNYWNVIWCRVASVAFLASDVTRAINDACDVTTSYRASLRDVSTVKLKRIFIFDSDFLQQR